MRVCWRGWVIGLLLACIAAGAEPLQDLALERLLQQAPTAKDYPRDSAVWLQRDMEITVAPSGAMTVHEHKLLKILTQQGMALANWEIPYDKACETLEVRTARTLLNGQQFPLNPTQAVESAAYPGVAWYDSFVVRRFPLPAAVVGATLEVDTVLRRAQPRLPGDFSTRLTLQHLYPIVQGRTTLRVPVAMPLTIRFTGGNGPTVRETQDKTSRVYTWTVSKVAALRINEPNTPPAADFAPSARVASLTGWAPVAAWYAAITRGKDDPDNVLKQVAAARTQGCATLEAKLAALHKAVREMPYVAVEMGVLSDVPHPAAEVLRRNYGDCKDKATLLKALLRAVGIPSHYVLVRTTDCGAFDAQLYGPAEFNHVILAVPTPKGDRFLDATVADVPATALPPDVEDAQGLIVRGKGELVTLPASTAQENLTDVRVAVVVKADGSATGTATMTFHGQTAALQRGMLGRVPDERYREALEATLAPRLGAEVVLGKLTVEALRAPERPLVITAAFTSPRYVQPAGAQYCGTLPLFMYQPNPYRSATKRVHPFQQRMESALHLEAAVTLPPEFAVAFLPAPVTYAGPAGSFRDRAVADDRTITYTCDLATKRGVFPSTALDAMRAWAAVLAVEGRNSLQFFVVKGQGAGG